MNIAAVEYRVPSRKISNDDVINHIDRHNPSVARTKKSCYLNAVDRLFRVCGARSRHWRDTDGGERAGDLILGAMDDALNSANMRPDDIDVLIYCGVGRGFIEPANAYFFAKARYMRHANCFDITDACMSWIRALQMAYLLLRSGGAQRVMIINGECHVGFHDNWEIKSFRALDHTFPMYTIGEAASATIVQASEDEWQFDYASKPELADLCTIPLQSHADFVEPSDRIGLNGINRFVSFGREILDHGVTLSSNLIPRVIENLNSKRWYFPHAPSKAVYELGFRMIGAPTDKLYLEVFPRFGNVVSASIPVALSLAQSRQEIQRGDPLALVPASAGMVASVVQFSF